MALRRPAFWMTFTSKMFQRDLRVSTKRGSRLEASNAISAFHENRVSDKLNARLTFRSIERDPLVSRPDKSRVFNRCDSHFKKTKSDTRVFINRSRVFFFQSRSMSLLLQLVQQYNDKCNQQLYRFNSTPTTKSELR